MTRKERVLSQIQHRETDYLPYAGLSWEGDVAERLDAHYGNNRWRALAEENKHIRKISSASGYGVGVSDKDPLYRDAFGTVWSTSGRPEHLEEPCLQESSLAGYDFPIASDFLEPGWLERAEKEAEGMEGYFLVTSFGKGLFERTWAVRGYQDALMDSVADPSFYEELVERIADLQMALVEELLRLPVDGIMFSDDWGDQRGVILGPERWRRLIKPHLAKLYDRVHAAGRATLSHCCGSVIDIMPDLIEIGLDVIESVQPEAMDPYELKREYGKDMVFWGGLGSQSVIPFGTPEQIRSEVRRLCAEMGRGGGYILGPAKGLQPETSTENAAAVVEAFLEEVGVSI